MIVMAVLLGTIVWYVARDARPASAAERRDSQEHKRLARLNRQPGTATRTDLGRLLRAHDLDDGDVALVLNATHRVGTATLWAWAQRHDVHALTAVARAGLDEATLRRHLADGTLPDLAALRVRAALTGERLAPVTRKADSRRPAAPTAPVRRAAAPTQAMGALPTVYAPGLDGEALVLEQAAPAAVPAPAESAADVAAAYGMPLSEMLGDEHLLARPELPDMRPPAAGLPPIGDPGTWPFPELEAELGFLEEPWAQGGVEEMQSHDEPGEEPGLGEGRAA
ncbi:hypothetical protein [Nocardioides sp. GY 10127]|uniref:hypothetical protein n=1 Tax=Nocardioides sp. GY 10127 TaxID=2569762 RepID=UPI0010A9175D|nr:hypothetical protein [Nocardioides sp. GY 10127]TIC86570.1 hypothetical protein E8D37_01390 [Nocardioides sp. GY 10127]